MKPIRICVTLVILILTGCQALPFRSTNPALSPAVQTTSAAYPLSTAEVTPGGTAWEALPTGAPQIPLATFDQSKGPLTLQIWVPPQFDPGAATKEGSLLNQRLEDFKTRRPGIQLTIRVKALEGPGGLLDMLSSASAAAPGVLPDLVALPRPMMEAAALKGLLHPYDGLSTVLDNSDWYAYALQLAHLQKSTFGLPFAGDAIILTYRPSTIGDPPRALGDIQTASSALAFPASDPQALFTLALYQAAGGAVQDEQGRPSLDPSVLARVLAFFQKASQLGLTPAWLGQYETEEQVWSAFAEGKAGMAVTWASQYLIEAGSQFTDTAATTLPTLDGEPYTLATGWVWALAGSQVQNQPAAVQLAEFLTESDFMAQWTAAAGFLPTRPSALAAWPDEPRRAFSSQVLLSAHPYPAVDVLSSLAPVLRQSTVQILNNQGDPYTLAQEVAQRLNTP